MREDYGLEEGDIVYEELLTVQEVAEQLCYDETTIRRWIQQGTLEAIVLPHRGKRPRYRVKQSTVDKWHE